MERLTTAFSVIYRQLEKGFGSLDALIDQYKDPVDGNVLSQEEKDELIPRIQRKKEFEDSRRYSETEDPALLDFKIL